MTIIEQDIKLTSREKFNDFFNSSPLVIIVMIPVVIIVIVLMPFFLLFGLTYEYVIEKYFYKWTGKIRKNPSPKIDAPYADLSISIDFKHICSIDKCYDCLKEKYNLSDKDFENLEIGFIKTEPNNAGLADKYFDFKTIVFQDKLFVQEIKFPEFRSSIGYIDSKSLSYEIIKEFDFYPMTTFSNTTDELIITIRQKGLKKLLIMK